MLQEDPKTDARLKKLYSVRCILRYYLYHRLATCDLEDPFNLKNRVPARLILSGDETPVVGSRYKSDKKSGVQLRLNATLPKGLGKKKPKPVGNEKDTVNSTGKLWALETLQGDTGPFVFQQKCDYVCDYVREKKRLLNSLKSKKHLDEYKACLRVLDESMNNQRVRGRTERGHRVRVLPAQLRVLQGTGNGRIRFPNGCLPHLLSLDML